MASHDGPGKMLLDFMTGPSGCCSAAGALPNQWTPSCLCLLNYFLGTNSKILSPSLSAVVRSQKKQVAVNPEAPDHAPWQRSCLELPAAGHPQPRLPAGTRGPEMTSAGRTGSQPWGRAGWGSRTFLVSWDCYLSLSGRKAGTNAATSLPSSPLRTVQKILMGV